MPFAQFKSHQTIHNETIEASLLQNNIDTKHQLKNAPFSSRLEEEITKRRMPFLTSSVQVSKQRFDSLANEGVNTEGLDQQLTLHLLKNERLQEMFFSRLLPIIIYLD